MSWILLTFLVISVVSPSSAQSAELSTTYSPDSLLVVAHSKITGRLSVSQVHDDVELLVYAMHHAYGGRDFIPADLLQKATVSLKSWAETRSGVITPNELCREIDHSLLMIPDGHLIAFFNGQFCSKERKVLFQSGKVGSNISIKRNQTWDFIVKKSTKAAIPVFSIHRFPGLEDPGWKGFEKKLDEIMTQRPFAMIIDLRGAHGGDDAMARIIARKLYGQDFPSQVEAIVRSETPETLALWLNSFRRKPGTTRAELTEYEAKFLHAKSGQIPSERKILFPLVRAIDVKKLYSQNVFVLTDRECVSTCEYLVEYLKDHPAVTTVGENTGGLIHFGNVCPLVLPHSGITVQIPTQYRMYRDQRFLERQGYEPKSRVIPGTDALKIVLKLINKTPR